jgi:hypothetical protein
MAPSFPSQAVIPLAGNVFENSQAKVAYRIDNHNCPFYIGCQEVFD